PAVGADRGAVTRVKGAVTVVVAFKVTEQVPVPKQPPPLQPVKVEPVAGVAVSVTNVPLSNEAEQVAPQSIPGGSEVTVPLPVPALLLVRLTVWRLKVAVTVVAAFRVTEQVAVPEQPPPLQPAKVEPVAGVAVRVTGVPLSKGAEQVAPHSTPRGLEVTVPLPTPSRTTERVGRFPAGAFTTVSVVLPLRLPEAAVIVVVPAARPVAKPVASIVATVGSLLVQVTPPNPVTATGVNASVVVPLPIRPSTFRPH